MTRTRRSSAVILVAALLPGLALADAYVYPAKGQTKDQQEKDQYQCYEWAKGQTGFDPMKRPEATSPPPPQEAPEGGVGHGALRGAAIGAVAGGIAGGEAGKGAAIGALGGGMIGGMRRRHQAQEQAYKQQQWENQQVANYEQNRGNYDRAYAACLRGRGYTVN